MIRGGKLRQMRGVIYRLKRGFGLPLAINYQTANAVDLETGRQTISMDAVFVDRAIVLPSQIHKEFKYDIGYLKANSNFTYGGFFTSDTRQVIIDANELPAGFIPEPTDKFWIVYDHKRYAIKNVTSLELKLAYFIAMEGVSGVPTYEIHRQIVVDRLTYREGVSHE